VPLKSSEPIATEASSGGVAVGGNVSTSTVTIGDHNPLKEFPLKELKPNWGSLIPHPQSGGELLPPCWAHRKAAAAKIEF
jgi:hypothetical protein